MADHHGIGEKGRRCLVTSHARSDGERTLGWSAFTAWGLCGMLWAFTFLGMFSVGGAILPFAVLLTVLLTKEGLRPSVRRIVWIGFASWLGWWMLVLSGAARVTGAAMVYGAVAFLGLVLVAGPAGAGLLAGLGLCAVLVGLTGGEPTMVWLTVGMVVCALGVSAFLWRRVKPRRSVSRR
jgi:hypothetical protein